jgi:hypothetical protein
LFYGFLETGSNLIDIRPVSIEEMKHSYLDRAHSDGRIAQEWPQEFVVRRRLKTVKVVMWGQSRLDGIEPAARAIGNPPRGTTDRGHVNDSQ